MRRDVRMHALRLVIAALITCTTAATLQAQTPAPAQTPLTGVESGSAEKRELDR